MKNNLMDLANTLFDQIGALDDIDAEKNPDLLKLEIEKAKSKVNLSEEIIEIGKLQLDAQKYFENNRNIYEKEIPELIAPKNTTKTKPLLECK